MSVAYYVDDLNLKIEKLRRIQIVADMFHFRGNKQDQADCIAKFKDLVYGKRSNHWFLYNYFIDSVRKNYLYLQASFWMHEMAAEKYQEALTEILKRELWFDKFMFECVTLQGNTKVMTNIKKGPGKNSKKMGLVEMGQMSDKIHHHIEQMRHLTTISIKWIKRGNEKPLMKYIKRAERTDAFYDLYLAEYLGLIRSMIRSNERFRKKVPKEFGALMQQASWYRVDWKLNEKKEYCKRQETKKSELMDKKRYLECDGHWKWCIDSYNILTNKFIDEHVYEHHISRLLNMNCFYDEYIYGCLEDNIKVQTEIQHKYKQETGKYLPPINELAIDIRSMVQYYLKTKAGKGSQINPDRKRKKMKKNRKKIAQAMKDESGKNDKQSKIEFTEKQPKTQIEEQKGDRAHVTLDDQFITNIESGNDVDDESMDSMVLYGYSTRKYNYDNKFDEGFGVTPSYNHKELMDMICLTLVISSCAFIHCVAFFVISICSGWLTKKLVQMNDQKVDEQNGVHVDVV